MFSKVRFLLIGLVVAASAACASSPTASGSSPTPTADPSSAPSAKASPVSYDPCVLMTAPEASALTGVSYGAGREETASALKECIYGYQTKDVLIIAIAQAPDVPTAQSYQALGEALLQKGANNGLAVSQVQGVGDAAAAIQGTVTNSGLSVSLCGIYVLKGTIFFDITDVVVNRAAPSNTALDGQATTVLSRL